MAPLLEENIQHQALLLSPKKYNEVIASGYNAVSVKVALHNQAIYLLLNKGVQAERIVIDAFTTAKNYQKYVKAEKNQVTQAIELEEKAESKYLAHHRLSHLPLGSGQGRWPFDGSDSGR